MRHTDGPSVECETHIEADPARVWELVTDIELPARFSPELRRVRWLDGVDHPEVNARFEGHNRNDMLGEWRTMSYVVELDAPRVFAWAVVDPDGRFGAAAPDPRTPVATWRFVLEPAAGGTRLVHGTRIGPAPSGLTLAIAGNPDQEEAIIRWRLADLRAGMENTLQGIKSLAERPR
ncbi:SRPBCC family protein [Sphaerimonospora mesophila]|uniref:SRPBCC family protein n=1 Tax=Sphaerimonospora mesophila TaxID=37483 RepID=UPI0006E19784